MITIPTTKMLKALQTSSRFSYALISDVRELAYQRGLVRNFVAGVGLALALEQKDPWIGAFAVATPMPFAGYQLWTHRAAIKAGFTMPNDAELAQFGGMMDKFVVTMDAVNKPK